MNSRYDRIRHQVAERDSCRRASGGAGTPCTSLPTRMLRSSSKTRISAVGQQHLLQVVALVEEAEERPLEQRSRRATASSDAGDAACATNQLAEPRRERERQVGAEHVEAAVREVDDAHDAEDQRQPAGDAGTAAGRTARRSGTGRGRWPCPSAASAGAAGRGESRRHVQLLPIRACSRAPGRQAP